MLSNDCREFREHLEVIIAAHQGAIHKLRRLIQPNSTSFPIPKIAALLWFSAVPPPPLIGQFTLKDVTMLSAKPQENFWDYF